ncbi:MAG TPA: hypothetical protein VIA64_13215 [Burkholderiales bacterium]
MCVVRSRELRARGSERPTRAEWLGMALIAVALALVSWDAVRRHQPVEPSMAQE